MGYSSNSDGFLPWLRESWSNSMEIGGREADCPTLVGGAESEVAAYLSGEGSGWNILVDGSGPLVGSLEHWQVDLSNSRSNVPLSRTVTVLR